jgi:hypothetical protein
MMEDLVMEQADKGLRDIFRRASRMIQRLKNVEDPTPFGDMVPNAIARYETIQRLCVAGLQAETMSEKVALLEQICKES